MTKYKVFVDERVFIFFFIFFFFFFLTNYICLHNRSIRSRRKASENNIEMKKKKLYLEFYTVRWLAI